MPTIFRYKYNYNSFKLIKKDMEPIAKKLCTETLKESKELDSKENDLIDKFSSFKVKKILNNMEDKCSVAVEGIFEGKPERAVVLLQKLPFSEENLKETFSGLFNLRTLFKNDIYYNKVAHIPSELNELRVNVVYPAEEKHIKKYEKQSSSFIDETPELYKSVTLPFIESSSYSKQWIYNILDHKKETERIICEDLNPEAGFVLVPDMKWTGEQIESLYLQALIMRRDIYSIRELREEHIPLLKNIYDKCTKVIKEKYGVPPSKLRIYFHYQPSFYHLHIHFSALSFEAPGIWAGKAHLLKEVISNLEHDPSFYEKATLSFTVKDNHPLRSLFAEQGYFKDQ